MKITRFVNGEKLNKPVDGNVLIRKQIIPDTIEKVNRRLNFGNITENVTRVEADE